MIRQAIPQRPSLDLARSRDFYERKGIIRLHLEDRPWGMKEFYVGDPDGNLLKFGQPSVGFQ